MARKPATSKSAQGAKPPVTAGPRPRVRTVKLTGSLQSQVIVRGGAMRARDDLYHTLLTVSWCQFLGLVATVFFGVNLVFGSLYALDPNGITGARPGRLDDAFFFSVQTFGTIGYGVLAPRDLYANLITTLESFVGLCSVAVMTGLIFARVSRPTARVMFTHNAVITRHEGKPTLMFRCANQRSNRIIEAEVTLTLARLVLTKEGLKFRRLEDLKVIRSRSPLFVLSWLVMHTIDETSPLFGATPESLAAEMAEIIVVLSGQDETLAQRIHARHAYATASLVWNRQFADIVIEDDAGGRMIDYTRFHDLDA